MVEVDVGEEMAWQPHSPRQPCLAAPSLPGSPTRRMLQPHAARGATRGRCGAPGAGHNYIGHTYTRRARRGRCGAPGGGPTAAGTGRSAPGRDGP